MQQAPYIRLAVSQSPLSRPPPVSSKIPFSTTYRSRESERRSHRYEGWTRCSGSAPPRRIDDSNHLYYQLVIIISESVYISLLRRLIAYYTL